MNKIEWRDCDVEMREKFLKKARGFMKWIVKQGLVDYFLPSLIKEMQDMNKDNSVLMKACKFEGDFFNVIAEVNILKNAARIKKIEGWYRYIAVNKGRIKRVEFWCRYSDDEELVKKWREVLKTRVLEAIEEGKE